MEMFRTKKVHCLICDKILEADWNKKEYNSGPGLVGCGCPNRTTLDNSFNFPCPNSIISACDKTKLRYLIDEDDRFGKKGEWHYVRPPEDENTPKFDEWVGQTTGGFRVVFKTKEKMTPNTCRQLLKKEVLVDEDSGERIYHFHKENDDSMKASIQGVVDELNKNQDLLEKISKK